MSNGGGERVASSSSPLLLSCAPIVSAAAAKDLSGFPPSFLFGMSTSTYQQTSDPCDSTLSSEFRIQWKTEYLLEAFHLQHRAIETRQKLSTMQAETAKGSLVKLKAEAKMSTGRALSSVRNNFKEIQRSLEVWLARILGDLEGMLARDVGILFFR